MRDCNDALRRGEELGSGSSGNKLISEALLWKASALEHLADCAADYEQVILLLRRSLETCHSEEAQIRLKGALFMREQYEELKSMDFHFLCFISIRSQLITVHIDRFSLYFQDIFLPDIWSLNDLLPPTHKKRPVLNVIYHSTTKISV